MGLIYPIESESENEVAQSCLTLCNPWTVAHQAPPSMGFSRQEYWSGLPFPSPGDLPDPGIEPRSPTLQADALTSAPPGKPNISYFLLLILCRPWPTVWDLLNVWWRLDINKKNVAVEHSVWRTWACEFRELPRTFLEMLLSRFIPFVLHSILKSSPCCSLPQDLCTLSSFCWGPASSRIRPWAWFHGSISSSSSGVTFSTSHSLAALFRTASHPAPCPSSFHFPWSGVVWSWFGFYHGAYYLPTNNIVYNLLVILIVCLSLPTCKFHKGIFVVVHPTLLEKFLIPEECSFKALLNGYINECVIKSMTSDGDDLELRTLRERLIFPGGLVVKNPPANAGDLRDIGSIPGSGGSLGGGNGNLLQYSCLENSIDRGAWWAIVHGVAKSQTRLSDWAWAPRERLSPHLD